MDAKAPDSDARISLDRLLELLSSLDRVLVAFSGGVDSSCLLAASERALPGRVQAVTAETVAHAAVDRQAVAEVLTAVRVPHTMIEADTLAIEQVRNNSRERCYHCKAALFGAMKKLAADNGLGVLIEGTNADDLQTHRPGLRALGELQVRSPLAELGLGKRTVRKMAELLGLSVATRPSSACLLTRLPYDVEVTPERLLRIDSAEALMRGIGVRQIRVRDHDPVARIEVDPADLHLVLDQREQVLSGLRELGWRHISLDLEGYRGGSFD